jgi:hypothetical protein
MGMKGIWASKNDLVYQAQGPIGPDSGFFGLGSQSMAASIGCWIKFERETALGRDGIC